jgi:hypothetical protein
MVTVAAAPVTRCPFLFCRSPLPRRALRQTKRKANGKNGLPMSSMQCHRCYVRARAFCGCEPLFFPIASPAQRFHNTYIRTHRQAAKENDRGRETKA